MSYFLKKCTKKGRVYLSIVNGYHDPKKGYTVQETYKSFGTGEQLIKEGISDPEAYCKELVNELNNKLKEDKINKVTELAPFKYLGHFLINAILQKLNIKDIIEIISLRENFRFNLYDVLCALIFSRILKPCSKYQTFHDVIPYLNKDYKFSYDQLLLGLAFLGDNYEDLVEIFTALTSEKYKLNTSVSYFDCTNFYFEIDKEDEFRKKGPSKENRPLPLLGMGLLLDGNQIPIGLKLFPGNQSEKPKIREIINEFKQKNDFKNKIVQVADKGLNCARNIYEARINNNGYIFSKSCKTLPDTEKNWIFNSNDYVPITNKDGEILYYIKECIDNYVYTFDNDYGEKISFTLSEKRVVTFNPTLAKKQLLEIQKLEDKARQLCLSKAKKEEYGECSKYVTFQGKDGKKANVSLNETKLKQDRDLCGYNLMVTSEKNLSCNEIYKIYHNLWRIEESFRMMKSELNARPVFLQKQNTIYGHFFVCYLCTLLTRILQIYELHDEESYQEIFKFFRDFQVVNTNNKFVNLLTKSDFLEKICKITKLPINSRLLTIKQYERISNFTFK